MNTNQWLESRLNLLKQLCDEVVAQNHQAVQIYLDDCKKLDSEAD